MPLKTLINGLIGDGSNERLKIFLGFVIGMFLTFEFGILALAIALGQVKAETSYGLGMVIGGLNTSIGAFAGWAFSTGHSQRAVFPPDEEPAEAAPPAPPAPPKAP